VKVEISVAEVVEVFKELKKQPEKILEMVKKKSKPSVLERNKGIYFQNLSSQSKLHWTDSVATWTFRGNHKNKMPQLRVYFISFRNVLPVALPAACLATLFPTLPLLTALTSPRIRAS